MKHQRIARFGLASLVALGSFAGVAVGASSVAGAQSTDTQTNTQSSAPDRPQHPPALDAAAKALNLSTAELRSKLEDGKTTIAAVAKAQGVDVNTVISAMVADATTHIDQAVKDGKITAAEATEHKADLTDHITKLVNEGRPAGQGPGGPGHHGPGLDAAAKALNLTTDQLRTKLEDGKTTIAAVAKAQGVDVNTVISAMVADATTHIDQAVKDGKIDAAKAAEAKSNLSERITKMVNEGRPKKGADDAPPANGDSNTSTQQTTTSS